MQLGLQKISFSINNTAINKTIQQALADSVILRSNSVCLKYLNLKYIKIKIHQST